MSVSTLAPAPIASPHAHGGNTVSRTMFRVQMALVPATLYGFWLFGWPAFFLWALTILSCLGFEALSLKLMGSTRIKGTLFDGSAMLTGWLLIRYWRGQPPFGRQDRRKRHLRSV